NRGANVLVVMTNDAWFKRTAAAEQHYVMSILRAVENRRYVVRCAATGISGVIDPWGRTIESTGIFQRKTIMQTIAPRTEKTFYTRFGDWFAYLCTMLWIAGAVFERAAFARRKRN
ncbi:MAG: nitrilase-related carbon-nitrogen hydrolase, partial [Armatimonadota bacterium]|nr:nitrilase-related carbon-nitrogen hydrolase [Armatimonadota bacterium]